ncbi:hypothetical protein KCU67_g1627, partial [Aureobasidium melanogenum]
MSTRRRSGETEEIDLSDMGVDLHLQEPLEAIKRDSTSPIQSSSSSKTGHDSTTQDHPKCISWALHQAHLIGLLVFLLGLIAALQLLYNLSERNQGLATATQNIHYIWTYGPTAIFSILAVSWGRLEYDTKILMPWKLILDAPCEDAIKRGLELDYISPNPIKVLWASARAKDWPVLLAVLGSQLITAITVVSTSLFVLQPTLVHRHNAPMSASARFDSSSFNATMVNDLPILVAASFLSGNLSITFPPNTNEVYAIEPFDTIEQPAGSGMIKAANISAFSADLDCQAGNVSKATMEARPDDLLVRAAFSYLGCTTDEFNLGTFFSSKNASTSEGGVRASTIKECSEQGTNESIEYLVVASAQAAEPSNITFGSYDCEACHIKEFPLGSFDFKSTVLFCKPSYKLETALVYLNSSDAILNISTGATLESLPLSASDLLLAFNSSISAAQNAFNAIAFEDLGFTSNDVLFQILISTSSKEHPSRYMDAKALQADVRRLFGATWTQIANQHLLSVGSFDLGTGMYSAKELRIVLRPVTIYLMDGGLMALAICTLIMVFVRPKVTGMHDLPTLGRISSILAGSPRIMDCVSTETLEQLHSKHKYAVASRVCRGIDDSVVMENHPEITTAPQPDNKMQCWLPMAMSKGTKSMVLILPLIIIAAIEATYHVSSTKQGLGDVSADKYLHYAWTLTPALTTTLVKILCQTLAFAIELLDPYLVLKLGNSSGSQNLFHDYLSGNSLSRCIDSIRTRRLAVFSVSLMTLLSPFLTIIVSGLFDTQPVPQFGESNITVADCLFSPMSLPKNLEDFHQVNLNAANLLIQQTIPYPAGSFDNFALPNIIIPANLSTIQGLPDLFNTSSVSVRMPGYQISTVCEPMNQSEFVFLTEGNHPNFTHPVLAGCNCSSQFNDLAWCHSSSIISMGFDLPDSEGLAHFYKTFDLAFNSETSSIQWLDTSNWSGPLLPALSSTPCPIVTIIYGTWEESQYESSINMSGVACYFNAAQVDANVSYTIPQQMITNVSVLGSSPVPVGPGFWPFVGINEGGSRSIKNFIATSASGVYDNLAMALLNNSNPDPTSFFTPSNAPIIAERASHIYDMFLTQYYSQVLRNSSFSDGESNQVPAVLVDENRQRLFQNRLSTSILEGLLASI